MSEAANSTPARMQPGAEQDMVSVVARRLVLAGMTVALSMLVLGGVMLYGARQDAWHQARQSSNNLILALERDIARNIAVYDLSLQGAIATLEEPGINQISPVIRHAAIFDRAANAEYLGSILVLDRTGQVIADSTSVVPHSLNVSDRDYFQVQRDHTDAGLFVSAPFHSRLRNGDASIAISRRISGPDGSFRGVAMGAMRLAYFQDMFSRLDLGPNGAAALLHTDGLLIARVPATATVFRPDIRNARVLQHFRRASSGQFTAESGFDGVSRLITYRQVGSLPLVLTIAMATDEIYAPWRQKAIFIGSIMTALCVATMVLSLLFRRELQRRLRAEAQLAVVAATDALTGLANRRAFQLRLQHEWRRALRGHTPISVLMIDADHFKQLNDRYGHPAGDTILQGIAACIGPCLRRPADFAARYGGEEFVVLLPETDAPGAICIAECIRAAVAAMTRADGGAVDDLVTVSIGIAVSYGEVGQSEAALLKAADTALYMAKSQGRNRVEVAAEQPSPIMLPTLQDEVSGR